jgi:hypothetical protein
MHDREAENKQRRDVNAAQGRKILQIIPAQPDWQAVFAADGEIEEGDYPFFMVPLIGWALVEEDNETEIVAVIVFAADSNTPPDPKTWLLGEKMDGFVGFAYPGETTDWITCAESHREACLDETTHRWIC